MGRTKKVGITGRFGARYGATIRGRVLSVEKGRKSHSCPSCLNPAMERVSAGIWECGKCGLKMAGKAYRPA